MTKDEEDERKKVAAPSATTAPMHRRTHRHIHHKDDVLPNHGDHRRAPSMYNASPNVNTIKRAKYSKQAQAPSP